MDALPEELVLVLLAYLEPTTIANLSRTSSRYLILCRDTTIWKEKVFHETRAEAKRRRQELLASQDPVLAALRRAMIDTNQLHGVSADFEVHTSSLPQDQSGSHVQARAMANWDPSYPNEKVDFYQEYIHRHAKISLRWLQDVKDGVSDTAQEREAVGVGLLNHPYAGAIQQAISPLDDGSVCVWNLASSSRRGKIQSRSSPNLIFPRNNGPTKPTVSNEAGAVDNVSVDTTLKKAFIASLDYLNEIDLNTLQVVSKAPFPFPITALSKAEPLAPLTVGTLNTLHLHDIRVRTLLNDQNSAVRCELIGGAGGMKSVSKSVVSLSQPGPLSILHVSDSPSDTHSNDIWVAGRFTSLLNYDRRYWPRIKTTVFSGGRLSSLSYLPQPFVSTDLDLLKHPQISISDIQRAKSASGITLIGAGEYKGKGSLELYGLLREPIHMRGGNGRNSFNVESYQNRQTASRSRLLSVAPHGARLVYSDADGNVKWVERDGVTLVRSFNLNDQPVPGSRSRSRSRSGSTSSSVSSTPSTSSINSLGSQRIDHFSQTIEDGDPAPPDDIVQKIIPLGPSVDRHNRDDLLIWTGDGKLGVVGFGNNEEGDEWFQEEGERGEESDLFRKERAYGKTMRRALERHADEARFVRGLGLGPTPH